MERMYDRDFWSAVDEMIRGGKIVIDRPKDSCHPKFTHCVYPLDYGYLDGTSSMDGAGIDVWLGSRDDGICDAIVVTVDLMKRDAEIKLLIGMTEEEKKLVLDFHNDSKYMKGILIRRNGPEENSGREDAEI